MRPTAYAADYYSVGGSETTTTTTGTGITGTGTGITGTGTGAPGASTGDPGPSTGGPGPGTGTGESTPSTDTGRNKGGCGCASSAPWLGWMVIMAGLAVVSRRRSPDNLAQ